MTRNGQANTKIGSAHLILRLVGVEPTTSPLSGACLAATGYKSAALPIELQALRVCAQRHVRNGVTTNIVLSSLHAFKWIIEIHSDIGTWDLIRISDFGFAMVTPADAPRYSYSYPTQNVIRPSASFRIFVRYTGNPPPSIDRLDGVVYGVNELFAMLGYGTDPR